MYLTIDTVFMVAGRGGGGKRGRRSSASTKPVTTSLSVKSSQPKKVKRKDLAGATKPSSSKTTPVYVTVHVYIM